ncbi:yellow protein precursor [Anopheles darlingi]|uniref:Protein yellow n=1 Tax=Anopheles darlingi TaxID=43151 RepID=W5JWZ8_ANODA|nr:protein yellow [Anopheles darlingi]XP_049529696.1 protein yellow [Anopheles darlingi]ETN67900.1 yellow protein precursor [Anopheles darlingi]
MFRITRSSMHRLLVTVCLLHLTTFIPRPALGNDNLRVAYQWNQIDFEFSSDTERQEALASGRYIPENVIPVGLEVYKKRLFLTLPRWKQGIPASLAYINLNETTTQSPRLYPYPNWSAHRRLSENDAQEIVSPFRIRADRCGRLWVLDTGVDELLGNTTVFAPTSLLVYDLTSDNLLRRYQFPSDHLKENSFYANIAVEDAVCDDTFAYAADLGSPGLVVYSWKQQESWRVKHHFFYPDPLAGNYNITGINFQWDDGLFGLALSKPQSDGFATLFFHPLSSLNEFSVSTKVLRNRTYALDTRNYKEFKVLGSRGPNGQAGVAFLDQKTGVIFYALPNLNAVTCWKTSNRALNFKSLGRVYMSSVEMVFPNDVKVDDESRLWVLSDRLHQYMYESLNRNDINFRVLTATVKDAIQNTACDTNIKPLPDIITNLGDILRPSTSTVAPKSGSSVALTLQSNRFITVLLATVITLLFSSNLITT